MYYYFSKARWSMCQNRMGALCRCFYCCLPTIHPDISHSKNNYDSGYFNASERVT
jgi:hypothetical protein